MKAAGLSCAGLTRAWKKRAEEARNLAKKLEHPTTKCEMLLIASAYDKLAAATREVRDNILK